MFINIHFPLFCTWVIMWPYTTEALEMDSGKNYSIFEPVNGLWCFWMSPQEKKKRWDDGSIIFTRQLVGLAVKMQEERIHFLKNSFLISYPKVDWQLSQKNITNLSSSPALELPWLTYPSIRGIQKSLCSPNLSSAWRHWQCDSQLCHHPPHPPQEEFGERCPSSAYYEWSGTNQSPLWRGAVKGTRGFLCTWPLRAVFFFFFFFSFTPPP